MDDMKKMFEGQFFELIKRKIKFLSILIYDIENFSCPMILWIKTDNNIWYRLFTDAYVPHLSEHDENDKNRIMSEDFEEGEFDGNNYKVRDLMIEFELSNKKIINAGMFYDEINGLTYGKLKLEIENGNEIAIYDYGDFIDSQLIINGNRI